MNKTLMNKKKKQQTQTPFYQMGHHQIQEIQLLVNRQSLMTHKLRKQMTMIH